MVVFLVCGVAGVLFYAGVIQFNNPSLEEYPVRGVDVSAYQGDIDWGVLSQQNIQFAFIKATEGSSFADEKFDANYAGAHRTGLRVGAYHFFSFDSPGRTQADNFISRVPWHDGDLPPVVDFEFYGDKGTHPPDADATRQELSTLLDRLEQHYGVRPIVYATEQAYDQYLAGHYATYDMWISNIVTKPKPLENQTWTFWQYANRTRLDGYTGTERYIDLNVFNGSAEEFNNYART